MPRPDWHLHVAKTRNRIGEHRENMSFVPIDDAWCAFVLFCLVWIEILPTRSTLFVKMMIYCCGIDLRVRERSRGSQLVRFSVPFLLKKRESMAQFLTRLRMLAWVS